MLVNVLRVVNYLIVILIVFLMHLSNFSTLMFGVLLYPPLVDTSIKLFMWMTTSTIVGFILLRTNLMLRKYFIFSKLMLSVSLTLKLLLCSPTGVVNITDSMLISDAHAYLIVCPARTRLHKLVLLNVNIDILSRMI
jgi:hypothetical protein